MHMLGKVCHMLRVWTGLATTAESHLTPSHGWLLPAPADARQPRRDSDARGTALTERNAHA
jgi:hypothetical protein